MFTEQIVSLLIQERDRLNRAIEALRGGAKGRGRPPKNVALTTVENEQPEKKRYVNAASRKKMAAAQKKRWAAKKTAT
jgi:AT hook motif